MAKFYQSSETFFVEEIDDYELKYEGEHLYVKFEKKNLSTPFVASFLKKYLKIREPEIGYAGNKDKLSTSIQTFSLPRRLEEKVLKALEEIKVKVISLGYGDKKLRMGQLKGNRFRIVIGLDCFEEISYIQKKLEIVSKEGFLNFFGPQRIVDNYSIGRGEKIFLNKIKSGKRRDRFYVSVFQSELFNSYLKERMKRGMISVLLEGDILKTEEHCFILKDMEEGKLYSKFNLTGPIFGSKMLMPKGIPLEIERYVLEKYGLSNYDVLCSRVKGTRRLIFIKPVDLMLEKIAPEKIVLRFALPKGSYATVLLREIGVECVLPNGAEGGT